MVTLNKDALPPDADLKRAAAVRAGLSKGSWLAAFSIIEMVIVIMIMGILIAIAVPTYLSIVPRGEIKNDARLVMNVLQRARMSASNYQRPIRVLVDCTALTRTKISGSGSNPCRLEAQVAIFDAAGVIKNWKKLSVTDVELHPATNITYLIPANVSRTRSNFEQFKSMFNNFKTVTNVGPRTYGVYGADDFNNDSFVVVFTSGGEAITNSTIDMRFANSLLGDKSNWRLSIINSTGHIRLSACKTADCLS
ncbi:MAG: hypothetical protein LBT47_04740 [Deltaproteobacteria bacterium]|jgi:Tfp pilus assembly protein FimT|nr:hypothetical protein [Deltaproteobacteria bacterium]